MYTIYKLTSPSGKFYIGLTKAPLKERWRQHVKRADVRGDNHPLYNAIRKYGADEFTVEAVDSAPDKPSAQKLEQDWIARFGAEILYNLSPGGEADGETGSRLFWAAMAADPVAKAKYLGKLSAAKLANDWSDYAAMSQQSGQWRKENPKLAYYAAYRAQRIARRGMPPAKADVRTLKERLMWKHARSQKTRENAFALWARRTDSEKKAVADSISLSAKARWASITNSQVRAQKTAAARAAIDREKQGAAASVGLKKFWADLKADPIRYAAYMSNRTASLTAKLEKQK